MSTETIEGAVARATKAIDTLAKNLTKAGATAAQVEKAFTYAALRLHAAKLSALTVAQVPEGFKLDMDLPAAPAPMPVAVAAPVYPAGARASAFTQVPQPGSRAPTRSGLTVAEIGGRMCKDAREEFERRSTAPSSPTINGVEFIDDEDEDSPSPTADDGVDFIDED